MTTAIYVLTCPRPVEVEGANPWPYVEETLRQIVAEDVSSPHVLFVDGKRPDFVLPGDEQDGEEPALRWMVAEWERPHMSLRGNKLPYWALLRHALEAGFEEIVVFEDDLQFCANAVRRMVTFPVPRDLALVQFFAPNINIAAHMHPGLWRVPQTSYEFMQAVKLPRRTIHALVDWSTTFEFNKFVEADMAMNLALQRLGLRWGVHTPDLVQHIGENSAADPGASVRPTSGRVAQCFPDPGFDALRLYDLDVKYR